MRGGSTGTHMAGSVVVLSWTWVTHNQLSSPHSFLTYDPLRDTHTNHPVPQLHTHYIKLLEKPVNTVATPRPTRRAVQKVSGDDIIV